MWMGLWNALALLFLAGAVIALLDWLCDHPWVLWGVAVVVLVTPQLMFGAPQTGSALWWIDGALGFWALWMLRDRAEQKLRTREWRKQREQREYEESLRRP